MDALPFSAEDLDAKSQAFLADYAVGDLLGLCVRPPLPRPPNPPLRANAALVTGRAPGLGALLWSRGAFSEVHMAENRRTGQQVALKVRRSRRARRR